MTPVEGNIGERVGALRRRRGLTQEHLAEASGVDVSTVRKLEQGARHGARLDTLHSLARALDTRTSDLLGSGGATPPVKDDSSAVDLIRLRQVLTPIGELDMSGDDPDLDQLRRSYEAAYHRYERNEYDATARTAPGLITDARRVLAAADETQRPEAERLLAYTLHLAGSLLTQLRQFDLAYLPLREAVDLARQGGYLLAEASISTAMAWLLMEQGRLDDTEDVAIGTADRVEPRMSQATPRGDQRLGAARHVRIRRGHPQQRARQGGRPAAACRHRGGESQRAPPPVGHRPVRSVHGGAAVCGECGDSR